MPLPADFLERLKASNPIVEVMSEYVTTKRSGRDYVCLCPFHNEKTPSCFIHPDREYFHCFGCGAGGDVITFIMKYRNLDYMETVKYLAERANLEMPLDSYNNYSGNSTTAKRKRMYDMNRDAARFFYSQLFTPEGKPCLHYLINVRGLKSQTIKRYGMGYAPNSWTALKNHMMSLGYTEKELEEGNLISRSKNNTKKSFDFFVNRAMFPFIDLTGHIVGFGGRTLGDDKRKYVNSRDSIVYNKENFLFSLNIAKNAAAKTGKLLLCEGNLDVISLTQAGFENAVASCGTALTAKQVKLMSTYAKEVVICYDSDEAGQKAAQRAITLLGQAGLKTSVIRMKGAKDPDEYVKKFGAAAFGVLLDKADGAVNYRLSVERAKHDMESDSGKQDYRHGAEKIIAALESAADREYYGRKLAQESGLSYTVIEQDINSLRRREYRARQKTESRKLINFDDRRRNVAPDAAANYGESQAEEMLISYLYDNPDSLQRLEENIPPGKFVTAFNRRVYEFVLTRMKAMEDYSVSSMNEVFSTDEIGKITHILERGRNEGITAEVADDCIKKLLEYKPKVDVSQLSDEQWLERFRQAQNK